MATLWRAQAYEMLLAWRTFPDKTGDLKPAVELTEKLTKVYPLAQAANLPAMKFVNLPAENFVTVGPGDYQFWELLDSVVQAEPPHTGDPVTLSFFAAIGIEHGKPFAPDARMKKTLNFERNGIKPLDSSSQYYIYTTGVTSAMEAKMVGTGSHHGLAFVDGKGQPLDCSRAFRLHVPVKVPVKKFWSVIAYDNQARSFLQTDQIWPSVTSKDKDFHVNDDGSVAVYLGPERPRMPRTSSARAGMRSSGSTARSPPGSTRLGGSENLNRLSESSAD
jgi:hypothetical protein